ncbi:hypothetical protein QYF36_016385 [Acer negundo]|nr:hypothetical protein QYF36_016385 [Acer negundo]
MTEDQKSKISGTIWREGSIEHGLELSLPSYYREANQELEKDVWPNHYLLIDLIRRLLLPSQQLHKSLRLGAGVIDLFGEFAYRCEEERPILANSEFLLTQEGFAGTSNKVHVRLPARSAFAAAADAVATTEPVRLEVLILCLFEETMRMNPKGCFLTHMYPRAGPNEKRIFQEKVVQEKKRRRFRIDVLEKCGRSSALVESTAQFQCQPSWLSWVTGLMLRVEAIQRQERFGSRGHALSLPS